MNYYYLSSILVIISSILSTHANPVTERSQNENPSTLPADYFFKLAPHTFPSPDQKNYTFIDNPVLREALMKHYLRESSTTTSSEVKDLLADENSKLVVTERLAELPEQVIQETQESTEISDEGKDAELIENNVDQTEDTKLNWEVKLVETTNNTDFKQNLPIFLTIGTLTACLVAYLGFMRWRRRTLELRYGSRRILVNEDDMNDPNDSKHFTI